MDFKKSEFLNVFWFIYFRLSLYSYKKTYDLMTTYVLKEHFKIVKTYMVKFHVSILNRFIVMGMQNKYINIMLFLIIFLFLRQPKITLFIYLLIKQQGE